MLHRILHLGEEQLRKESEPVKKIDDSIVQLVKDMFETMKKANGVGLAAPQIGVNLRVAVIAPGDNPFVIINPRIIKTSGTESCEEGCLSLPGLREKVKRSARVVVEALNLEGEVYEIEADGLVGRAIQHEIDHLDGVLFIDRISRARRLQIKHELEIIKAGGSVEQESSEEA